jgi:GT2 family glycosyltransferase
MSRSHPEKTPRVAVVVTTYNRPHALAWVLAGLSRQISPADQIVIADDGSSSSTSALIDTWRDFYRECQPQTTLLHAWQPDQGFRAARARNKAMDLALNHGKPDVLIFLDGDCVAPPWFIRNHLALLSHGRMVAGGRGLLTPGFTEFLEQTAPSASTEDIDRALSFFSSPYQLWLNKHCDRYFSMRSISTVTWNFLRDICPRDERKVRTCNLSVWADDFISVDGFDESYVGWGLEDTDFAVRLLRKGIRIRLGRCATNVYHLWHPQRSRENIGKNEALLQACLNPDRPRIEN